MSDYFTLEQPDYVTGVLNVADDLKEIFLSKEILKFILDVDDFSNDNEKPRKETYTNAPTEKEQKLKDELITIRNENNKLKEENELYKNQALTQSAQNVSQIVQEIKYNDRERETHLQTICFLAFRLAEQDPKKFIKPSQKIYTDRVASILEKESIEHCINIRTKDIFQRKIRNSIEIYSNITEKAD